MRQSVFESKQLLPVCRRLNTRVYLKRQINHSEFLFKLFLKLNAVEPGNFREILPKKMAGITGHFQFSIHRTRSMLPCVMLFACFMLFMTLSVRTVSVAVSMHMPCMNRLFCGFEFHKETKKPIAIMIVPPQTRLRRGLMLAVRTSVSLSLAASSGLSETAIIAIGASPTETFVR